MREDAFEERQAAIEAIEAVLQGTVTTCAALDRVWPLASGDMLVRRAYQDVRHYLEAGWDIYGRFLRHHQRFLETGGTLEELDRVFDEESRR